MRDFFLKGAHPGVMQHPPVVHATLPNATTNNPFHSQQQQQQQPPPFHHRGGIAQQQPSPLHQG